MQFRSIVVPLDGSAYGEQALPYARLLARAFDAPITLLAVARMDSLVLAGTTTYVPPEVYQQAVEDELALRREYLARLQRELNEAGLAAQVRVEFGNPNLLIPDVADQLPECLIVMTTHGRTGIRRFVLGSVANTVVRTCERPVLLVRPSEPTPDAAPEPVTDTEVRLDPILITLDGSAMSEQVLPFATALAGAVSAQVTLLHIADAEADVAGCEAYLREVAGRAFPADRQPGVEVRVGPAPETILAAAADLDAELIAMTTHGRSGIGRWVLGCTTDRVLQVSERALLLIRAQAS